MSPKVFFSVASLFAAMVAGPSFAVGQDVTDRTVHVPRVDPLPEDVTTLDGIIAAFYDVISGPAGEPRQWGRDATLYPPNVQFTVTRTNEAGQTRSELITKQEFIDRADRFLIESGFVEREIHRVTNRFGTIADVASTYEWHTEDGSTGRGINFIHLYHDGERWWISHAIWDSERTDNPIPPEYLP